LGDALPQDAAEFAHASLDLDVIADQEDTPRSYVDLQAEMVAKLDATLEAWPDGATPAQTHALTIIAMLLLGKMIWDAKSDALLARVVGALSGDELRAHSDAIRRYENGAWRRLSSLPADLILRMEEALNLAKYLCLVLASNDIRRAWDPVMDFLRDHAAWHAYVPVDEFDLKQKHWAASLGYTLGCVGWRLAAVRGTAAIECYASWFQIPLPQDRKKLNFEDATLEVHRHMHATARRPMPLAAVGA
jgi:hypothetical protein